MNSGLLSAGLSAALPSAEVLESRCAALGPFIAKVAVHPVLRQTPELLLFLETTDDAKWAEVSPPWYDSSTIEAAVVDTVNGFLANLAGTAAEEETDLVRSALPPSPAAAHALFLSATTSFLIKQTLNSAPPPPHGQMDALTESASYTLVGEYMDKFQADVTDLDRAFARLGKATEARGETLKARGRSGRRRRRWRGGAALRRVCAPVVLGPRACDLSAFLPRCSPRRRRGSRLWP